MTEPTIPTVPVAVVTPATPVKLAPGQISLIPQWRQAWKFYCLHALTISSAIPVAYASLPPVWQEKIPLWAMATTAVIAWFCGIVGRVVSQVPSEPTP